MTGSPRPVTIGEFIRVIEVNQEVPGITPFPGPDVVLSRHMDLGLAVFRRCLVASTVTERPVSLVTV